MSIQIFGQAVSRGVAIGKAVLVASSRVDVAHYFIEEAKVASEIERLRRARDRVAEEFATIKGHLPADAPAEVAAMLDVHLMLLHDSMLAEATKAWVQDRHYNAEWALSAQLEVLARQFDDMEDAYLRERKADLEQVVERVLHALAAEEKERGAAPLSASEVARQSALADSEEPLILIANDISPADMLQFKRSVFRGFVTDVGGKTSHTAIVARSLDIPAVVGAREASRLVEQDEWVIVDGDAGVVIVDPSPMVLEEYRFRQRQSELERERLGRLRRTPAVTLDGESVELLANIELPGDAPMALQAGAQGIGLFRSEFLFLNRSGDLPDEEEQFEAYRSALAAMQGLPVTIRTIDIGADKSLGAGAGDRHHDRGLNPALGLRAIRWSLAEPAMFLVQLRALLRAAAEGPLRILVPMLAHEREILATRQLIDQARAQLRDGGHDPGEVQVGAMIEVPAAALSLPLFLRHFDFLSIGTNDLIQYVLAIDRSDESVAHLYDPWHPAVLRLVSNTIDQARAAGRDVTVCGEMAGDPSFTRFLLGLGLRSFSMHPAQIPSVKQVILRSDARRARPVAMQALHDSEHLGESGHGLVLPDRFRDGLSASHGGPRPIA